MFNCVRFILNVRFKKEFQFERRINDFETSNWGRHKTAVKSCIRVLYFTLMFSSFITNCIIICILEWRETSGPEENGIQCRVQSRPQQQKDGEGVPGWRNHLLPRGSGKTMQESLSHSLNEHWDLSVEPVGSLRAGLPILYIVISQIQWYGDSYILGLTYILNKWMNQVPS